MPGINEPEIDTNPPLDKKSTFSLRSSDRRTFTDTFRKTLTQGLTGN